MFSSISLAMISLTVHDNMHKELSLRRKDAHISPSIPTVVFGSNHAG